MKSTKLRKLYSEARTGKLFSWEVWTEDAVIVEEYGPADGKKTINRRTAKGKNIGKTNETTPADQAIKEATAKHTKKLEGKYSTSKKKAKNNVVFLPMLAQDLRKQRKPLEYPVDAQPKLDGGRCLAMWDGDEIKLMTRTGKFWDVAHIAEEVSKFLPKGLVLDGELYIHGMPLQDIMSLARKPREGPEGSILLEYHCYDCFFPELIDTPWYARQGTLRSTLTRPPWGFKFNKVKLVQSTEVKTESDLDSLCDLYEEQGYEGAIIRKLDGVYNLGHRSKDLLKFKRFIDHEFEIVGYYEAEGNDEGTVCWTCATKEGKEFRVRPMGTRAQRAQWLKDADSIVGKQLTVKFQQYSKDNIPTGNTVGVCIRDYE